MRKEDYQVSTMLSPSKEELELNQLQEQSQLPKKQLSREQLEREQARNLKFLEVWSETHFPSVRGVSIVRGLVYELIQKLNGASMREMLE